MAVENCRVRFMNNNLASLTVNSLTASSESVGFESSNAFTNFRSSVWKTSGYFNVDSTRNIIYFNDGADKTATITVGEYTTPDLLATEIQTQLNSVSSGFTVSYNLVAGSYKFTIANTSSVTIRFSQTTNAAWEMLGYLQTTDSSGTSFDATEQRNHYPEEFIIVDFGYQAEIGFLGIISDVSTQFPLSNSATVKLQLNNINDFSAPPIDETLSITNDGIFKFFDTENNDLRYRYAKVSIADIYNPDGPSSISFGNIYMGPYDTLQERNVWNGFNFQQFDPSTTSESQAGVLYFDSRTRYTNFGNIQINYLDRSDRSVIESLSRDNGITTPFYISLDPTLKISDDVKEFTKFVRFVSAPTFGHNLKDKFSTTMTLREVV